MKKIIVLTTLIVGGFSLLSLQNSSNQSNKIEKKPPHFWLKLECTKTYPSGSVYGNRCVIGGPLLQCTEVNPNCDEIAGS